MVHRKRSGMIVTALAALAVLAGCAQRPDPAPVVFRGTQPGGRPAPAAAARAPEAPLIQPTALPAPGSLAPDGRGVIDYGGYSAVVARPGDTVASIAQRVGLSAAALANYNGLPAGHVPRAGDELILPPDTPVQAASAQPSIAAAPLDAAPSEAGLSRTTTPPAPAEPAAGNGFDLSRIERAIDGEPAARPAPQPQPAPAQAPAAAAPSAPVDTPAPTASPAQEPQVAALPATPPDPPRPAVTTGRFVRPVSGEIVRPFSRAPGAARSDGIDFAAPAGSEVVAVAPGQVALVSEAIGGNLGTVVLIRHENQVLTVYGRVGNVAVAQGDRVRQGQTIGTVAPAPGGGRDSLHFEVRRGTEPVDPGPFFGS